MAPVTPPSIAIIGGGITGSTLAWELSQKLPSARVHVFDQGRGLGGRMAHRCIRENDLAIVNHGSSNLLFDHGCALFRGDTQEFRDGPLRRWLSEGWAAEWQPSRIGGDGDFFGIVKKGPVYSGIGGMHTVATQQLLKNSAIQLSTATRIASVRRVDNTWFLEGLGGNSAYHDTNEKSSSFIQLGSFDAVVCTDASSLQDSWHRAGAGLPREFVQLTADLASTPRLALFTSLILLDHQPEEDAFAWQNDPDLWFAARTSSKPGLEETDPRCWTLISTPEFAAREIQRVPMRDPETGAFRPQNAQYIRKEPAATLLSAFHKYVDCSSALVVGGQRWGSAFPAPDYKNIPSLNFLGTNYATDRLPQGSLLPSLPSTSQDSEKTNSSSFIDGATAGAPGIYFAGDFCFRGTSVPPGVEAATLSALALAKKLASSFPKT